jgi:hypothetical protein
MTREEALIYFVCFSCTAFWIVMLFESELRKCLL